MRANEKTVIVHQDVILVPYRTEHVAKYHEWMTSAELRELTASEPLTLEEEYEMQRKWQTDEDKLTFILLSGTSFDAAAEGDAKVTPDRLKDLPMIGDVNLFLKGTPEDEDFEVEVEIMIAEPAYRRRGIAYTALQLMLSYATDPSSPPPLPIQKDRLVARIGDKNEPSIKLFEKLGFAVTKRVAVFEEVELRYTGTNQSPWTAGVIKMLEV
ncbi:acyl-CoA N-acyltransferase [Trametes cingulata]|nr:acyl-CoA N-acyltransferase [Trametes cingulata]